MRYTYKNESKLKKIREMTTAEKDVIVGWFRRKFVPDEFGFDDFAQQIVGALILSAPFLITQEVWDIARLLDPFRLMIIMGLTLVMPNLILRYTNKDHPLKDMKKRIFSLIIISYAASFFVLYTVGIIGNVITDQIWVVKLVILVSLFSAIGAATVDLIR